MYVILDTSALTPDSIGTVISSHHTTDTAIRAERALQRRRAAAGFGLDSYLPTHLVFATSRVRPGQRLAAHQCQPVEAHRVRTRTRQYRVYTPAAIRRRDVADMSAKSGST